MHYTETKGGQPFNRRELLRRGLAVTSVAVAGGALLYLASQKPEIEQLIGEFDTAFSKLKSDFPETRLGGLTGGTGQEGQEGYAFKQINYGYTLLRNQPNSDIKAERVLESQHYHGLEKNAPSDPIIEYWINPDKITSNYRWWGRGTDQEARRDEESVLDQKAISTLSAKLREDFARWTRNPHFYDVGFN